MALELVPSPDPAMAEAARRAIAGVGAANARRDDGPGSRWWWAGLSDAVEARAVAPAPPAGYSAFASPRSTRGATRA
jgi:hypothetical protein